MGACSSFLTTSPVLSKKKLRDDSYDSLLASARENLME